MEVNMVTNDMANNEVAQYAPPTPISRQIHRIDLSCARFGAKGILWSVAYGGKLIIDKTRVPAFEACRYLLAIGARGKLVAHRAGEHQFTIPNIEIGAQFTVTESPTKGLVLERYRSFPGDEEANEDASTIG